MFSVRMDVSKDAFLWDSGKNLSFLPKKKKKSEINLF